MTKPRPHVDEVLVSAFGRTDRGRVRGENQDRLFLADLGRSEPEPCEGLDGSGPTSIGPVRFALGLEGAVLFVADGMGGRAGGARASGLAVSAVCDVMGAEADRRPAPDARDFAARMVRSLVAANATIHDESSTSGATRGMGTTATLVGILGRSVYVAQVGDSRAYLLRGGQSGRLTRDQSLVQDMIDAGVLTEDDVQSAKSNMLLQAIGTSRTVRPAVTHHELCREDVILLCSDGLTQLVRDEELASKVAQAVDCETLCEELISLANERGGPDNITVLVARVDGEGLQEPRDSDAIERKSFEIDAI
jgi:protein phosphatase